MKKNLLKSVSIIIVVLAGIWLFNWYQGKNAPSLPDTTTIKAHEKVAYFAGGCFWCTESDFEKIEGVKDVISGYMGGDVENPSYNQVAGGGTGHREAVKVTYDPNRVSFQRLVFELLRETDPTDSEGSFYDRGHQYTSAIYYSDDEEKRIAKSVIERIIEAEVFDAPIATTIEPAGTFWVAEDYHQNYHKKNPLQYKYYRNGSGRDDFIKSVWGDLDYEDFFEDTRSISRWEGYQKPDDETLKKILTPIQYQVTQEDGTERSFQNEYWDNHEEGIYVDIVSGEPLFSSTDKFDSGTGWPSFLKPIDYSFVTEHDDYKLLVRRTEIRSRYADSHLGHIILDGPIENDKIRYCMNSAALRFIPKEDLEEEGLGEFSYLFE